MATITSFTPRSHGYLIDNILVDEYAEKIGAIGIAIYNVLSRYADRKTGVHRQVRVRTKSPILGKSRCDDSNREATS